MTEDEWLKGFKHWLVWDGTKIPEWIKFVNSNETFQVFIFKNISTKKDGHDRAIEEARTLWRIQNSPLMKALE